jgi:hypothetical protein
MNDEDRMMQVQQGLDQLGAVLRDVAPIIATYYRRLKEDGMPARLAAELVLDLQGLLLQPMLAPRPDTPPGQP